MKITQQERFDRLKFPVHKVTAKTPEELFQLLPGLRRYFQRLQSDKIDTDYEDEGGAIKKKVDGYRAMYRGQFPDDLVKIIKYIVFLYDQNSDLLDEYSGDIKLMKESAAKEAGFHRDREGNWPKYIQDIMEFKEPQVVQWIIDYLKVQRNPIWTELKFIEEEIDSLYRNRTSALLRDEIKSDYMRAIKERIAERDELLKRFYAEHSDLKRATQEDLFPVTPENVFKELKIPPELWKVRQVKDVSTIPGVPEESN